MKHVAVRIFTWVLSIVTLSTGWTMTLPALVQGATPPPPTTITVQETPQPSTAPDFIITSIVGNSLPQYIELFNQGNDPFNLDGWTATITVHDTTATGCSDVTASIALPSSWVLPKKYLTLEHTGTPASGSLTYPFSLDDTTLLAGCTTPVLGQIALVHASDDPEQTVIIPANEWSLINTMVAQHRQRNNSLGSTRSISGTFDTDYKLVTGAITLNSDPLYTPPADAAGLQILEILPNARSCSPLETDPTCNDYVKLYNPTDQPINLALYRLRAGYKGQGESVANTFTWGRELDPSNDELVLPPNTYFMLAARNDGLPISITDTGNFIWVEDAYGTVTYEPVVAYPDASSTTKVGQAWAYDGTAWLWTSAPQPNAPNYFPPIVTPPAVSSSAASVSIESLLKPCNENQYRNPVTNRCNSIVTASSALAPCGEGEERNPLTNRCRSIVTASAELAPCPEGSERNPATNRCRQIASVAGASTTAATSVKDVLAPSAEYQGWLVAGLAILLAASYALYEWRQDLVLVATHSREHATRVMHKLLRRE